MMALGVNLQKYSLNTQSKIEKQLPKFKQKYWMLGLVFYISSGIMLSIALLFASQSQLSPLMSMVLVSNVVFAHFLLGENISKIDALGILIIIVGLCITTTTAPRAENILSKEELIDLYTHALFICYVALIVAMIVSLYFLKCFFEKRNHESEQRELKIWRAYGITFAALAGCFGGLCVTFMKSATTIIVEEANEGGFVGLVSSWLMWILIAVLGTTWVFQLYWLNKGLEKFPVIFIVSIEAIVNEFVAVLGGTLYFEEYKMFSALTGTLFGFGLVLGMTGVALFASQADLGLDIECKEAPSVALNEI